MYAIFCTCIQVGRPGAHIRHVLRLVNKHKYSPISRSEPLMYF